MTDVIWRVSVWEDDANGGYGGYSSETFGWFVTQAEAEDVAARVNDQDYEAWRVETEAHHERWRAEDAVKLAKFEALSAAGLAGDEDQPRRLHNYRPVTREEWERRMGNLAKAYESEPMTETYVVMALRERLEGY